MGFDDEYEEDVVYSSDVKHIMHLFEDRDNAYINATQKIVDTIGPTVLEALYELFAVPVEQVRWLDFQSTNHLLIIVCSISFNPVNHVPQFIHDTCGDVPTADQLVNRVVRVGIPYELVMSDSEEVLDFLLALVNSHKNEGPTLIEYIDGEHDDFGVDNIAADGDSEEIEEESTLQHSTVSSAHDQFDPTSLTSAQRTALLVFQHQTRGKIH